MSTSKLYVSIDVHFLFFVSKMENLQKLSQTYILGEAVRPPKDVQCK